MSDEDPWAQSSANNDAGGDGAYNWREQYQTYMQDIGVDRTMGGQSPYVSPEDIEQIGQEENQYAEQLSSGDYSESGQEAPSYWEDPLRVARYFNALQTSGDEYPVPDWLDADGIEAAYKWLEYKNEGKPWQIWQPLEEGDPGLDYLRNLPTPPISSAFPRDEQQLTQAALQQPPIQQPTEIVPYATTGTDIYNQYQQPVANWEGLQPWQQAVMTLTTPQPMTGRPEYSRVAASLGQGALTGLGVVGAGGLLGSIIGGGIGALGSGVGAGPGAVAGFGIGTNIGIAAALPLGLAQAYASYTGEEIPLLQQVLSPFNYLAEGTERTWGLGKLATVEGMDKIFANLPAAWQAAALNYETMNADILDVVARAAGDQPAAPGEVWRFSQGYIDPVPLLNQARDAEGARGVEALQEARDRIAGGEDAYSVWMDYNDRFGDTGTLNDFVGQALLDPLNYLPFASGKVGEIGAKLAGKPELATAFKASQGNLLIDTLPPGLQQLAEALTNKQGSTGLITALRQYGDMVRGAAYPGVTDIPKVSELDWFDRAIGGLDKEGKIIDLTAVEKPNFIQRLTSLKPESQAILFLDNFVTNATRMAFDFDDPSLGNVERTDRLVKMYRQYAGTSNVAVGDLGEAMLKSPMTATTSAAMKSFVNSPVFEEMVGQWVNTNHQKNIAGLNNLANILGIHPSKLVEDLKNNAVGVFNVLIDTAEKSKSPQSQLILQDAQTGRITPESLANQFAAFTGEKMSPSGKTTIPVQPWTFDEWRARVNSTMQDYAGKWAVDNYQVKQSPTFFRFANALKAVQSLVLLDLNPGYLANNFINNWVTRAAEGVFGYLTPSQIDGWNERFGAAPVRLSQGVTPSGMDMTKATGIVGEAYTRNVRSILDQAMGDDNMAKVLRMLGKTRSKIGVASKLSGKIESMESRNAYTIGMQRMWDKLWRPGVGYKKMDVALEAMLRSIDPRLPDYVYNSINSGVNAAEVEKKLFSDLSRINVSKHIDDAATKILPDNPDLGRELLRTTGMQDEIEKALKNAKNVKDIDEAFYGLDSRLQDFIDKKTAMDISTVREDVVNRIKSEGFSAAASLFSDAQTMIWERSINHFKEISELVSTSKDAPQAERHAAWREQNARESLEWKRVNDFELQVYSGIIEALWVNTDVGKQFVDMITQKRMAWRDFYDGYDVNVLTGERVNLVDARNAGIQTRHIEGKNDIQRNFFTREVDYGTSEQAWREAQDKINALSAVATATELNLQTAMDQMFASIFNQSAESQQAALSWRGRVSAIRSEMVAVRDKFIATIQNDKMTAEEKRKRWEDFIQKEYLPLIGRLQTEEIAGAQDMVVKAGEEVNPKPPSITESPADDSVIRRAADIVEEADKIKIDAEDRYNAKLSRDDVLSQWKKAWNASADEMKVIQVVMDLQAQQWAKRNNTTPDTWWNRVAAAEKGGDGVELEQSIFQAQADVNTPEFNNWFGKSKVVDDSGKPLVVYHGTEQTFDTFDFSKIRTNGTSEGVGFYFTDSKIIADNYKRKTGNTMPVYLSINKPVDIKQRKITDGQLRKILLAAYRSDPENNGLMNYGDINYEGLTNVVNNAIKLERGADTDLDLIGSLGNGGLTDFETLNRIVKDVTGYDGVIVDWGHTEPPSKVFIAFTPEQIKSVSNIGTFDPNNKNIFYQVSQNVLSLAQQYGIPTSTEKGEPNNRQIINIVKKYGGEEGAKVSKIEDVTVDLAQKAFEARRIVSGEMEQPELIYAKGAVEFLKDGRVIVKAMKTADVSTMIHELGHIYRRDLSLDDIDTVAKWAGLKDGNEYRVLQQQFDAEIITKGNSDYKRYVDAEEKFSRAFERYLAGEIDIVPPAMVRVFEQLREWMVKIYHGIKGSAIDVEVNPVIRDVFDRMLFDENTRVLGEDIKRVQDIADKNISADAELLKATEQVAIEGEIPDVLKTVEKPVQQPEQPKISDEMRDRLTSKKILGNQPAGSTPSPLYEGMLLDEVNTKHLRNLINQVRDEAKASILQKPVMWSKDLPDNVNKGIRSYWNNIKYTDMPSSKLATTRYGGQMRDMSLLNYNNQHGLDSYLNLVYPYQFWYTRTMMNWAQRMIDKPAIYAMYVKMRELQRKYEAKGVPSRLRGKMRVAAPYLPDWAGGTMYFDPLKQIFPFDQFGQPLANIQMQKSQQNQRAVELLKEELSMGNISNEDYTAAVKTKDGYTWKKAYTQAGAEIDNEVGNPVNMVNMMMSPAMYLTAPYNVAKGTPEKISPLPATRAASSIETALQDTPLSPVGNFIGMVGAGPERFIRKQVGLSEFGEWGDYYVDRQLSNMAADGTIGAKDALQAMMERQGTAYDQAIQRVRQEMMLRTPGTLPIVAAKGFADRSANALDLIMSLPLGLFSQGLLPAGELEQRGLKEEYNQAWERKNAGDKNAVNDWFKEHPEYESRLALWDEPEERLRDFLVSEIWDRYYTLEGPNRGIARDQMGDAFNDVFMNPDTRDYTAIDIETLSYWARLLGGYVPKTQQTQPAGDIPLYQQQNLNLLDADTAAQVQQYWDERDRMFPGVTTLQQMYYDGNKSGAFVNQHPELERYWDWSRQYKETHPAIASYLAEQAGIKEESTYTPPPTYIEKYYNERERLYPNISAIQQEYYDSGKNRNVLDKFPELKQYWDWNRQQKLDNPKIADYIEEQKKKYSIEYGGESIEDNKFKLQPEDFSDFDASLLRKVYGYAYAGEQLGRGAKEDLRRIWEKQDRPGGDFDEYLVMIKEYIAGVQ